MKNWEFFIKSKPKTRWRDSMSKSKKKLQLSENNLGQPIIIDEGGLMVYGPFQKGDQVSLKKNHGYNEWVITVKAEESTTQPMVYIYRG